jgi:hypothetical protein
MEVNMPHHGASHGFRIAELQYAAVQRPAEEADVLFGRS